MTKTTIENVTENQLHDLAMEALAAGDPDMAALCNDGMRALAAGEDATEVELRHLGHCVACINHAEAQE